MSLIVCFPSWLLCPLVEGCWWRERGWQF